MDEDTREQAAWLAEMYKGVAEGRELQTLTRTGWISASIGPDLGSDQDYWRLKPEPRECVSLVGELTETCGNRIVVVPIEWRFGMKVRVTEI